MTGNKRQLVDVENCNLGRQMEIQMVEVLNEVKHLKEDMKKDQDLQRVERTEMKDDIKSILSKFDSLDDKFASKNDVRTLDRRVNANENRWKYVMAMFITTTIAVIGFLLKVLLFA